MFTETLKPRSKKWQKWPANKNNTDVHLNVHIQFLFFEFNRLLTINKVNSSRYATFAYEALRDNKITANMQMCPRGLAYFW